MAEMSRNQAIQTISELQIKLSSLLSKEASTDELDDVISQMAYWFRKMKNLWGGLWGYKDLSEALNTAGEIAYIDLEEEDSIDELNRNCKLLKEKLDTCIQNNKLPSPSPSKKKYYKSNLRANVADIVFLDSSPRTTDAALSIASEPEEDTNF